MLNDSAASLDRARDENLNTVLANVSTSIETARRARKPAAREEEKKTHSGTQIWLHLHYFSAFVQNLAGAAARIY